MLSWRKGSEENPGAGPSLEQVLVDEGLVTEEQIDAVLVEAAEKGVFFGHLLVVEGALQEREFIACLVKNRKIPYLNLVDYDINEEIIKLLPPETCKKYHLLPVDKMGKILTVAMVNPMDHDALQEVREACPDLRIKPILCDWRHYQEVCERYFETDGKKKADTSSVSMESLGLSPTAKKSEPKPKADPAPPPAAEEPAPAPEPKPVPEPQATTEPSAAQEDDIAPATNLDDLFSTPLPSTSGATAAQLAEAVREGMTDAMATLSVEMRALMSRIPTEAPPQADLSQATAALTEAANRLMEAANAAMQATQNAQVAEPAQNNTSEKEFIDATERRTRFNSVQAFGVHDESLGDASVLAMLEAECPLAKLTFDTYCVSPGNEFTIKVCRTIAENPASTYNPCFVHGAVGSGKTHLLSAVGNAIRAARPEARVGYAAADRFAERMAAAKKDNAMEFFREAYAQWDVLILDDAQFLAGNAEAQEEFFHVFNALHNAGRQILIAADKAPKQLGHLEARLVSRFESGILTQLEPPDHGTRVAILRQYAAQTNAPVPDDVFTQIASQVRGDIRALIGAQRKVIAFAETVGQDITSDIADQVLAQLGATNSAA